MDHALRKGEVSVGWAWIFKLVTKILLDDAELRSLAINQIQHSMMAKRDNVLKGDVSYAP